MEVRNGGMEDGGVADAVSPGNGVRVWVADGSNVGVACNALGAAVGVACPGAACENRPHAMVRTTKNTGKSFLVPMIHLFRIIRSILLGIRAPFNKKKVLMGQCQDRIKGKGGHKARPNNLKVQTIYLTLDSTQDGTLARAAGSWLASRPPPNAR